ncbi:MAG TPA: hypothetical protein VLG38_02670 [Gammaproteobacteria bacterium]|nr:hypothetical protein [Gammaproteobacteria bacterium]
MSGVTMNTENLGKVITYARNLQRRSSVSSSDEDVEDSASALQASRQAYTYLGAEEFNVAYTNAHYKKEMLNKFIKQVIADVQNSDMDQDAKDFILDQLFADPGADDLLTKKRYCNLASLLSAALCVLVLRAAKKDPANTDPATVPAVWAAAISFMAMIAFYVRAVDYTDLIGKPVSTDLTRFNRWIEELAKVIALPSLARQSWPRSSFFNSPQGFKDKYNIFDVFGSFDPMALTRSNRTRRELDFVMQFMHSILNDDAAPFAKHNAAELFSIHKLNDTHYDKSIEEFLDYCKKNLYDSTKLEAKEKQTLLDSMRDHPSKRGAQIVRNICAIVGLALLTHFDGVEIKSGQGQFAVASITTSFGLSLASALRACFATEENWLAHDLGSLRAWLSEFSANIHKIEDERQTATNAPRMAMV